MRAAHPLARALIARLPRGARVLEIGHGSGRNHRALEAAGFAVVHFDAQVEPPEGAAGALSTHALLHGSPEEIAAVLAALARRLVGGAPLLATFGSRRDARFGKGTALGPTTFAPTEGDERGVAHSFFDEAALRAILAADFAIEELREVEVDAVVGGWAHASSPLRGAVHWFLTASCHAE